MTKLTSFFLGYLPLFALSCATATDTTGSAGGVGGAGATATSGSAMGCPSGLEECSGACTNTAFDPKNCGACGTSCEPGEVCSGGMCALTCQAGLIDCAGICTDTMANDQNCGGCGKPCEPGEICNGAGQCALSCQAGLVDCGGVCTNTMTSDQHCGACDKPCVGGETCDGAGQCALSCGAGLTECNGVCTNTNTDDLSCGGCGLACPAGEVCDGAGKCKLSCQAGLTDCSGVCSDLAYDPQNCGACSKPCAPAYACVVGSCLPLQDPGSSSSCKAILQAGGSVGDGTYLIDTDGMGPNAPFPVYCDMTTLGGGWTRCLDWTNTAIEDYNNNIWFDQCIAWTMAPWNGNEVMVKIQTAGGGTVYAQSGMRSIPWTQNNVTCPGCAVGEHHLVELHTRVILGNGDEMMISGKNAQQGGCIGDMGNGYGIVIWGPNPPAFPNNNKPRAMVMPYREQVGGNAKRGFGQSNVQWFENNEITYDGTTNWDSCGFPPGYLGTFGFYVR